MITFACIALSLLPLLKAQTFDEWFKEKVQDSPYLRHSWEKKGSGQLKTVVLDGVNSCFTELKNELHKEFCTKTPYLKTDDEEEFRDCVEELFIKRVFIIPRPPTKEELRKWHLRTNEPAAASSKAKAFSEVTVGHLQKACDCAQKQKKPSAIWEKTGGDIVSLFSVEKC